MLTVDFVDFPLSIISDTADQTSVENMTCKMLHVIGNACWSNGDQY